MGEAVRQAALMVAAGVGIPLLAALAKVPMQPPVLFLAGCLVAF
ncbi:hypothetical protein [Tabrizicola thermarum]|nr:hypothetical protein [Tabrizicola thermarum]